MFRFLLKVVFLPTVVRFSKTKGDYLHDEKLFLDFEQDTLDSSGNDHHGTGYNMIYVEDGITSGYAAQFQGNSSIRIPNHPDFYAPTAKLTIAVWIKTIMNLRTQEVIALKTEPCGIGTDHTGYSLTTGPAASRFFRDSIVHDSACSLPQESPQYTYFNGVWHFLVLAVNGSHAVMYIDGVKVTTYFPVAQPHQSLENNLDLYIGGSEVASFHYNYLTNNTQLDKLRFFNRCLTLAESEEVRLYDLSTPTPTAGPSQSPSASPTKFPTTGMPSLPPSTTPSRAPSAPTPDPTFHQAANNRSDQNHSLGLILGLTLGVSCGVLLTMGIVVVVFQYFKKQLQLLQNPPAHAPSISNRDDATQLRSKAIPNLALPSSTATMQQTLAQNEGGHARNDNDNAEEKEGQIVGTGDKSQEEKNEDFYNGLILELEHDDGAPGFQRTLPNPEEEAKNSDQDDNVDRALHETNDGRISEEEAVELVEIFEDNNIKTQLKQVKPRKNAPFESQLKEDYEVGNVLDDMILEEMAEDQATRQGPGMGGLG